MRGRADLVERADLSEKERIRIAIHVLSHARLKDSLASGALEQSGTWHSLSPRPWERGALTRLELGPEVVERRERFPLLARSPIPVWESTVCGSGRGSRRGGRANDCGIGRGPEPEGRASRAHAAATHREHGRPRHGKDGGEVGEDGESWERVQRAF